MPNVIVTVGQHRAQLLDGTTSPYEALARMGVAPRNLKRRGRGWLAGQADSGRCNWVGWYEGLPLLTAVSSTGAITGYGIAPARTKDQRLAETFLALRHDPQPGLPRSARLPAACLWWRRAVKAKNWPQRWTQCYGATVIAKPKRSAPDYWPQPARRWHARIRQSVETVHDRLLATFGLEHERPHDLAGYQTRLAAKVGLHTFCLWLNVIPPIIRFITLQKWFMKGITAGALRQ